MMKGNPYFEGKCERKEYWFGNVMNVDNKNEMSRLWGFEKMGAELVF